MPHCGHTAPQPLKAQLRPLLQVRSTAAVRVCLSFLCSSRFHFAQGVHCSLSVPALLTCYRCVSAPSAHESGPFEMIGVNPAPQQQQEQQQQRPHSHNAGHPGSSSAPSAAAPQQQDDDDEDQTISPFHLPLLRWVWDYFSGALLSAHAEMEGTHGVHVEPAYLKHMRYLSPWLCRQTRSLKAHAHAAQTGQPHIKQQQAQHAGTHAFSAPGRRRASFSCAADRPPPFVLST